jgi:hypothetical protein
MTADILNDDEQGVIPACHFALHINHSGTLLVELLIRAGGYRG